MPTDPGEAPVGLDLALGWLQGSIDDLAEATRRTNELTGGPSVAFSPSPALAGLPQPASQPIPDTVGQTAAPAGQTVAVTSGGTPPGTGAAGSAAPKPTPLLDSIGRDLTKLAAQGQLAPVIGRDDETAWIIEVLLRSTKRNPVLLGPAGVGKTAIVEGLAQRIVAGRVPPPLLGVRIIEVPLSSLAAGTQYRGQLEERMAQLISEASQPSVILFFDEIHLLVGTGRGDGVTGAAEALKPALARGDIAVIGATTEEEYGQSIANDADLARRFTTVVVPELDRDATRPILASVRDALARIRGVTVSDEALDVLLDFADRNIANRRFPDKAIDLLQQAIAAAIVAGRTTVSRDDAVATTALWSQRASSTPTLERFGRDLVSEAKDGKLGPIVGRDRELEAIIEVLLRQTKRNPLLIGPAGTGKTAIVEGLALRIAAGNVPAPLRDIHLFDVPLLSLASGVASEPSLLGDLLLEIRHPSVIVFFDEMHLLASPAVKDLGESLKPALARGEIACIGATTSEEYQAYLEPETALARRFSIITIEPMDPAAVQQVLASVRDSLAKSRGITVSDAALSEIVALADQYLPNRSFPDKGVDLIEQSVSYAMTHGRTDVDAQTAREAVSALLGMPLDPTAPLAQLADELRNRGVIDAAATTALLTRLSVSLRGLDARQEAPDAVVLLCDGASASADPLARLLARIVFGRESAVVDIDLAGMTDDSSMSTLLGSAPGLIGSDRPLPLHELRRSPWQVVLLRDIDACAVEIRDTIAAALSSGSFTDAMGRTIPLGAAIVVLTAPQVGMDAGVPADAFLAARLGQALLATCDVISDTPAGAAETGRAAWIRQQLLDPLAERLDRGGYVVTFDDAFTTWLGTQLPSDGSSLEAYLDRNVTPVIVAALPTAAAPVTVTAEDGKIAVTTAASPDGGAAGLPGPA